MASYLYKKKKKKEKAQKEAEKKAKEAEHINKIKQLDEDGMFALEKDKRKMNAASMFIIANTLTLIVSALTFLIVSALPFSPLYLGSQLMVWGTGIIAAIQIISHVDKSHACCTLDNYELVRTIRRNPAAKKAFLNRKEALYVQGLDKKLEKQDTTIKKLDNKTNIEEKLTNTTSTHINLSHAHKAAQRIEKETERETQPSDTLHL